MNAGEALLVLASLALAAQASAYTMLRSKFVRPVRSWRTIPSYQPVNYQEAMPAYYPAYDEFEAANNNDYQDEYDRFAEEPGSNLPIGQETWFEAEKSKVNDAFMQNLMELYKHEPAQPSYYGGYDSQSSYYNDQPQYYSNDEQQLKLLKRASDASDGSSSSTEAPATSTRSPSQGQKEVAMLRPPNPPKGHAEVKPTAHPASVYDAIKRLLTIENLQEGQTHIKKTQKRFAPSEESLVKQLNGLKKMSA